MKMKNKFKQYLLDTFPHIILAIAVILCLVAMYFFSQWQQATRLNIAYADQSLLTHELSNDNALEAYSMGYLLAKNDKPARAVKAFDVAEATDDPHLQALAKHALGNLYANTAEADLEDAHGSRHLVARILLAREAYKGALRLEPDFYAARYNLERLDRISPQKRGAGSAMIDGYTIGIDPFKQNGRALMKDNTRRGLP
jgi:mxaK protein